jgi:ABC-type multidrug transport system ATPase subunit
MRIIAGLIEPTSGEIRLGGACVSRRTSVVQRRIGLCSADERSFYPRLSALENLRLFGQLHGLERRVVLDRIARYSEVFGMESYLHRPFQTCSSGQRQRINLVRGMLHEPDVLMLDEAARSADPATVELLKVLVREYVEEGRLLLYTSHEFEGIESLCDHIVVLDHGSVVLSGPREIVLSRSYRQASTYRASVFDNDPDNRLLWRANKRRLDAEVIRDAMLAVSSLLDTSRRPGSLVAELEGQGAHGKVGEGAVGPPPEVRVVAVLGVPAPRGQ